MICRGCLKPDEQFIINNSMVKETGGPGECERCKEDVSTLYAYKKIPGATIEDSVVEEEEEAGEEEEVVPEPKLEAPAEEVAESIPEPYIVIDGLEEEKDGDTDDAGREGDAESVPVPEVQEESIEGEEEAEAPAKTEKRTKAELEAYVAELEAKVQK